MRKVVFFVTAVALITAAGLTGSAVARDRLDRVELTANQIVAELDARVARIKADLRLTPEQEEKWSGFESAVHDINKKRADHQVAPRAERPEQKGPVDFSSSPIPRSRSMRVSTISRRSASRMS